MLDVSRSSGRSTRFLRCRDETEEAKRNALASGEGSLEFCRVADIYIGHDRHAKGGDAVAQEFHEHDLDAVVRARYGHHGRRLVRAADAPHVRVFGRIPDAVLERNTDHLSQRTDGRRTCADDRERPRNRHGRRSGVCGRCCIGGSRLGFANAATGSPILPTTLSNSTPGSATTRRSISARSSFSRSIRAWAARCGI